MRKTMQLFRGLHGKPSRSTAKRIKCNRPKLCLENVAITEKENPLRGIE
jgi:hypothetical protein